MANGSSAVYSTLSVSDGTTNTNLYAFLALTPEPFAYDLDGNLTSDGRWDYTYDAENRLVSMQTHVALTPTPMANADAQRLEFKYDYLGRRAEKLVRGGWNGTGYTTVVSDEKFVWNGWAMMAKLNAQSSNALVASYYWGLDWSGTLQGAGGIGGLALTVDSGNTYLPMYDGNGNVMGMIKASTGTIDAAYEYDAFGNTIRESGAYAASNPFRFSTKFTDLETGLVYYGLRYYSPTLGRFVNKDPLEEKGGLNLYAFCRNNGVNHWDLLGQSAEDDAVETSSLIVDHDGGSTSYTPGGIDDPNMIDANGNWFYNYGYLQYRVRRNLRDVYPAGFMDSGSGFVNTYGAPVIDGQLTPQMMQNMEAMRATINARDHSGTPAPNNVVVTADGRRVTTSISYGPLTIEAYDVNASGLENVSLTDTSNTSASQFRTGAIPNNYVDPQNALFTASTNSLSRSGIGGAPMAMLRGGAMIAMFAVSPEALVEVGVETVVAARAAAKIATVNVGLRLTVITGKSIEAGTLVVQGQKLVTAASYAEEAAIVARARAAAAGATPR